MSQNDDEQVGRLLTRREMLALFGKASVFLFAACSSPSTTLLPTSTPGQPTAQSTSLAPSATPAASVALPTCVVRPEQTEGPYFVDEQLNRSDIRSDPTDGSTKE